LINGKLTEKPMTINTNAQIDAAVRIILEVLRREGRIK
jgi:hypothetical protein